ncbi:MAG: hypothetical protein ABI026_09820 [Gemmatimonadaceae bacterium]
MTQISGTIGEREAATHAVTANESLAHVIRPVLARWPTVVGAGFAVALIFGAWSITRARAWTSTASFMPESPAANASLSSLAVQFGVSVGSDPGQSLQFYSDLLISREILTQVATGPYAIPGADSGQQGDLYAVYGISEPTEPLRRDALLKRLRRDIHATNSPKTGVVSVTVAAPTPVLARSILSNLISAVSAFNVGRRQSRAGAERKFLEVRLADAKSKLLAVQNQLQAFMQTNRTIANSPRLTFEQNRLQQQQSTAQQQVSALTTGFEQARLEEVRNTPVVTVLETPDLAARPDSRGGLKNSVLGAILGMLIASIVVVLMARFDRSVKRHVPLTTFDEDLSVRLSRPD